MKNVFSYFRIVFLGVMILSGVARAAGRVNPADKIAEALQQARLWDNGNSNHSDNNKTIINQLLFQAVKIFDQ